MSSDITITNFKDATLNDVQQTSIGSTGNVNVSNYGTLTLAAGKNVKADKGDINITAYHALNVLGTVSTTGSAAGEGDILLYAYPSNTSGGLDTLNITGTVTTVAGNIALKAGDAITGASNVSTSTGTITQTPNMNEVASPPPAPPPATPTMDQCISNPSLSGCVGVLPTLETCTTAPTTAGCSVVLPPIDVCVTNPTQTGCSAVLPSLSTCTSAPTTPGCTVVLLNPEQLHGRSDAGGLQRGAP
jgi:hypothetical protein